LDDDQGELSKGTVLSRRLRATDGVCFETGPQMADMQAAQAEYMKQFHMQAVLEALVNETLEKEPSDPFVYMVSMLNSHWQFCACRHRP
jgi:hypothetical protein